MCERECERECSCGCDCAEGEALRPPRPCSSAPWAKAPPPPPPPADAAADSGVLPRDAALPLKLRRCGWARSRPPEDPRRKKAAEDADDGDGRRCAGRASDAADLCGGRIVFLVRIGSSGRRKRREKRERKGKERKGRKQSRFVLLPPFSLSLFLALPVCAALGLCKARLVYLRPSSVFPRLRSIGRRRAQCSLLSAQLKLDASTPPSLHASPTGTCTRACPPLTRTNFCFRRLRRATISFGSIKKDVFFFDYNGATRQSGTVAPQHPGPEGPPPACRLARHAIGPMVDANLSPLAPTFHITTRVRGATPPPRRDALLVLVLQAQRAARLCRRRRRALLQQVPPKVQLWLGVQGRACSGEWEAPTDARVKERDTRPHRGSPWEGWRPWRRAAGRAPSPSPPSRRRCCRCRGAQTCA